jgi:predicted enzyme related to lactoylglutathione lyase
LAWLALTVNNVTEVQGFYQKVIDWQAYKIQMGYKFMDLDIIQLVGHFSDLP